MRDIQSRLAVAALASMASFWAAAETPPRPIAAAPARILPGTTDASFDGVVEAVRQAVVAAQVTGTIVELDAREGDRVRAGQTLLRIDARAADQDIAASDAQVQAARASLVLAEKDFERQRQLFGKNYISRAAMERAEAVLQSERARTDALLAQARASRTQGGHHVVRAPFDGVVAEVPVMVGDMALPGRPLLTIYDPAELRVRANVPQSVAIRAHLPAGPMPTASVPTASKLRIELPGMPPARVWVAPVEVRVLPTIDPGSHTVQLRADLPAEIEGVAPGMFARLWLPVALDDAIGPGSPALSVPARAIVRRAELTGLYVLNPQGAPVLRQVRLGRTSDGEVEVLSGLMPGEQVVGDPDFAARLR